MQIKSEIRKQLLQKRSHISQEIRNEISDMIWERLLLTNEFKNCKNILCYCGKEREISTEKIILSCLKENKKIALPVCVNSAKGEMIFKYIGGFGDLDKGSFGVKEPKNYCKAADLSGFTVCITPGVCYNASGYRIGYGKGFYDRFFKENGCFKIGLCYNDFITEFQPDENDIPVDMIITEKKTIYAAKQEGLLDGQQR